MKEVAIVKVTCSETSIGGGWALVTKPEIGQPSHQQISGLAFYKDAYDEYVCCDGDVKPAHWFFVKYCYRHNLKLVKYDDLLKGENEDEQTNGNYN